MQYKIMNGLVESYVNDKELMDSVLVSRNEGRKA